MKAGSDLAAVLACLAFAGATAHAQPAGQAAATAQFDKGRAFLKDKKYAEACAAFEQSQKLDPQNGTLYNLAGCYTHIGKLASAWAAYRELAQRDTNDKRKKDSVKQAAALDKRLPKLVLKAAPSPAGLAVTLDGLDVTGLVGSDNPIDLGEHKVHASAPKLKDFDTTVNITDEGKTVTVAIELAPPAAREPVKPPAPPAVTHEPAHAEPVAHPTAEPAADREPEPVDHAEPPKSHRKLYGIIVAAGGGALVATGLVFGQLANSKWSDAKKLCGSDLTCDNDADLMKGNKLVSDARSQANISTALTIGGAVAIGVGVVLVLTAPKDGGTPTTAWRLTPTAGPDAMGLDLSGRF